MDAKLSIGLVLPLLPVLLISYPLPTATLTRVQTERFLAPSSSQIAFNVTFYVRPVLGPYDWLLFNGTRYSIGQSSNFSAGIYEAQAMVLSAPCPPNCVNFENWTSTGSVEVDQPSISMTKVNITGPGSLTSNYSGYWGYPSSSLIGSGILFVAIAVMSVLVFLKKQLTRIPSWDLNLRWSTLSRA